MLNIMLVDDEPIILKGLINIIEKGKTPCSEIVCAYDGVDALEKLETFKPDLIITDIQMPGMNGLELIKNAKFKDYCKRFILLTGYDESEYLHKAIKYKVIDYLLKPIDKAILYDILADTSLELLDLSASAAAGRRPLEVDQSPPIPESYSYSLNVKKIVEYIAVNYACDLSLDQVAEHIYLHPNYISTLFKKETGITFIQYLHLYRIKKAKEMMMNNLDVPFHIISERVGYQNERHFFNVFKKYSGVTPGEFRSGYQIR